MHNPMCYNFSKSFHNNLDFLNQNVPVVATLPMNQIKEVFTKELPP